ELQCLLDTRVDDRVPDAPDARRQQVQAEEARKQKIDVARPLLGDERVADRRGVLAAGRLLHGAVDLETGQARIGTGRVVPVDDRGTVFDEQGDPARPEG